MNRPIPSPALRSSRWPGVALAVAVLCAGLLSATAQKTAPTPKPHRPGDPDVSIFLEDIGFETPQPRMLTSGATMLTVNFVDDTHLLLTYNSHGLLARLPDITADDDDRLVTAQLIELPSGKVLAQTKWRTRDRQQYLWPLTHGLFLLRVRSHLTVIDPLRSLNTPDPFQQKPFLEFDRRIGYVSVSPGGDLLVVETVPQPRLPSDGVAATAAIASLNTQNTGQPQDSSPAPPALQPPPASVFVPQRTEPPVEIRFYRLLRDDDPGKPPRLIAQFAGTLATRNLTRVPATSEGFLDTSKESDHTWLFDFQSHAGQRIELSPFDTTCPPSTFFVSRSEFVALGCQVHDKTKMLLSGFNLRGEEPWISALSGQQIAPYLVTAPAAGRFAFSRILLSNSFYDLENLLPDELSGQEITVFQHHDGRILLKTQATPIQRAGQNFDISPNGLSFAVFHDTRLDIYALPKLTEKDRQQLKLAATAAPEPNDARIALTRVGVAANTAPAPSTAAPSTPTDTVTVTGNTVEPAAAEPTVAPAPLKDQSQAVGDPTPDQPRPPPSLYTPDHPKPPPG